MRGIAAAAVMLFHYTTRYDQLFVHVSPVAASFSWGHLGVNLFFMISGFVIFMTLSSTRHPLDFVVSRASRLYPTYWLAVCLTFGVVHALTLPGKDVTVEAAATNALMFHGLFGVKHVDNVYWTLEVELLFYVAILGLWVSGLLHRFSVVAFAWLGLRVSYLLLDRYAGIELPYIVSRFLILEYIPYFVIGMVLFEVWRHGAGIRASNFALILAALATIALGEGLDYAAVSVALAALLAGAALYQWRILRMRWLLWLGAISYPLYLVHENIGWAVILLIETHGGGSNIAVAAAISIALSTAYALHRKVEMPAMRAIRLRYKESAGPRTWSARGWTSAIGLVLAGTLVGSYASYALRSEQRSGPSSAAALSQRQEPRTPAIPCPTASDPLVFLALGQSNAGNHATDRHEVAATPVVTFWKSGCHLEADPLPGGTGTGASLWSRLAVRASAESKRDVVIAIIAVESTEIAAWVAQGALREELLATLVGLQAAGLPISAILWQQGEADAMSGTSAEDYMAAFRAIHGLIQQQGVTAPVLVARSTYCRGDGHGIIHRAQQRLIAGNPRVLPGPDTDRLKDTYRSDRCHFNGKGLDRGSDLWLDSLRHARLI